MIAFVLCMLLKEKDSKIDSRRPDITASLFTLDSMVDAADKRQGSIKADYAEHEEKCIAHKSTIAKIEQCLHGTTHT